MKIILTTDDVKEILTGYVFSSFNEDLDVLSEDELQFNDYILPYTDLIFEKKPYREVKMEDIADMVIEQVKARGEQDAI